ncbi:beta-propeller fold lactonase family protein [Flammeovirga agarivorans]|uniref:40-residue YVTN family beta-propeller repeat-containing protein n=1 Tax=Flammeovirga agarivorans TaxID=2726742 RepID=A0A7X8SKR8_9BACT|nr:hypothetical protein [Flammeovirga agarivorans]NLR91960.1 hypothetical protein [Flammeovirga agarivorans]
MKKFYKFQLIFAFIAVIFSSCVEDKESTPYVPGSEGFQLNSYGQFGKPNTTSIMGASIFGDDSVTVSQQAYKDQNGEIIGGHVEGFTSNGELTVITTSVSEQIIIANTKTLEKIHVINSGVETPRYAAFDGNYAYVTQWGPVQSDFSYNDPKVHVVNLSTGSIENSFSVGSNPEGIAVVDGKILVAASNTTEVEVYNTSDLEKVGSIDVGVHPQHFVYQNNEIWVSLGNGYNPDWSPSFDTAKLGIAKIDVNGLSYSNFVNYPGITNEGNIQPTTNADEILAIGSGEIVVINTASKNVDTLIEEAAITGVAQNPSTNDIYVALTPDYENPGKCKIYNESGDEKAEIPAGVNPVHFIFY